MNGVLNAKCWDKSRQRAKKLISYVRLERRQNNIQIMIVLTMKNGKIDC